MSGAREVALKRAQPARRSAARQSIYAFIFRYGDPF